MLHAVALINSGRINWLIFFMVTNRVLSEVRTESVSLDKVVLQRVETSRVLSFTNCNVFAFIKI